MTLLRESDARVLVLDDEPANTDLLVRLLGRAGFQNVHAINDQLAFEERFRSLEPDLILLDLHMPRLDGFGVLQLLDDLVSTDEYLPVLVLTADLDDSTCARALAYGANDFVTKPFRNTELLLRIRNLLQTRSLYLSLRRHNALLAAQLADVHRNRDERVARRNEITKRVQQVIDAGGPTMVFQPIIELTTSRCAAVEALSRFPHRSEVPPDVWFAEAAEVGLGIALELSAIASAARSLPSVPPGALLSVNASARTIGSPALLDLLRGMPADRIIVELTEQEAVDDYPRLHRELHSVRNLGARLAVDDAGGGFASLRHILELEPFAIKLDRLLIVDVDTDPARRALVSSLVQFSEATGSWLIAEGIETEDELRVLTELGVPYGQGYFLGRPGPLDN